MEWMEQVCILGLGTMRVSACDGLFYLLSRSDGGRGIRGKGVGVVDSWKFDENGEDSNGHLERR